MSRICSVFLLIALLAVPMTAAAQADVTSDNDTTAAPLSLIVLILAAAAIAFWISMQTVEPAEAVDEETDVEAEPKLTPKPEPIPEPVSAPPPEPEPEPAPEPVSAPEPEPTPEPEKSTEPDNLRIIEGIGPKVSAALIAAGIETFAKVAASDPETLEQVLRDAGVRIIPGAPATWPDQAKLAAAGDIEALEKLQDALKGGRRA